MNLLKEIQKFTDTYQISFQFWGKNENNVFIMKNDVDLFSTGGLETAEEVMTEALQYLYRITATPKSKRIC